MYVCSNEWSIEVLYTVKSIKSKCRAIVFKDLKEGSQFKIIYIRIPQRTGGYALYPMCQVFDLSTNTAYTRKCTDVDNYLENFECDNKIVREVFEGVEK